MKRPVYLLIFILVCNVALTQEFTISGNIHEEGSKESLIAANVYAKEMATGTTSNNYGFYSLTLPQGKHTLTFSYVGYQSQSFEIELIANANLDIFLKSVVDLDEVEVVADRVERIEEQVQMSSVNIPIQQIKTLPSFLGEVDVLKTMQLMPGIQSSGTLQSDILVRGGSKDQNLILLDGVPLYNVSHVLGLFSVFNPDAIKNVEVIKGGFPARYGGRLSSVVEMSMKDGNKSEFHGEGSIGLISSKLMLEGPIGQKTSFLLSGRRMYWDLLARPLIQNALNTPDISLTPQANFHDINAKIHHRINDKNDIYLSLYHGRDVFRVKSKFQDLESRESILVGPVWGNKLASLHWNRELAPKIFWNNRLSYTNYQLDFIANYEQKGEEEERSIKSGYLSGIADVSFRSDVDWVINPRHFLKFGFSTTRHQYNPGIFSFGGDTTVVNQIPEELLRNEKIASQESFIFVEDRLDFGRLKGNIGLHFSHFHTDGSNFYSLEPRLGFNYALGNNMAFKLSYARMQQYINLITSENLSLPSDFWVPTSAHLKPQVSHQLALGLAKTINNSYEASIEGYYKKMNHVVSYKEGSNFFTSGLTTSQDWENSITQGQGEAFGLEFLLQKKLGRFTGWMAYTLAWNNRQFDEINSGRWFPFFADRRHDLAIVGNYKINDRIRVSASWTFATGNAVSIPNYVYLDFNDQNASGVNGYTNKNSYRLSPSHRLDLSVELTKQKKNYQRTWAIGFYNAYNYISPMFATKRSFYNDQTRTHETRFQEIGVLPIMPSISYKIKF